MIKYSLTIVAFIATAVFAQRACRDRYNNCSSLVSRVGCCYGKNLSSGPYNQWCCSSCKKVDSSAKCKKKKLEAIAFAKNDLTGREGLSTIKFEHTKRHLGAVNGNHTCTKPEERKILD
jgi:hypothetical protein